MTARRLLTVATFLAVVAVLLWALTALQSLTPTGGIR